MLITNDTILRPLRVFESIINTGVEWTAYVFDAVPMVVFVVLFSLYHPSIHLPHNHVSLY